MEDIIGVVDDLLECPVCHGLPPAEIYQCPAGHVICASCYSGVSRCPQCNNPYEPTRPIRNTVMEALLMIRRNRRERFPCQNWESGCATMLQREEVGDHEQICSFRNSVKLCELLGYSNCKVEVNLSKTRDGVSHLLREHNCIMAERNEGNIIHREWDKVGIPSVDISWSPVIFKLGRGDRGGDSTTYALIHSATNKQSQSLAVTAMLLEGEESPLNYEVNYILFASSNQGESLFWKISQVAKLSRQIKHLSELPVSHISLSKLGGFVRDNDNALTLVVHLEELKSSIPENNCSRRINVFPVQKGGGGGGGGGGGDGDSLGNFQCDFCGNSIMGLVLVQYICLNCPDFSICQTCMTNKRHDHHIFAMVVNHQQKDHLGGLASSVAGGPSILEGTPAPGPISSAIFSSPCSCHGCGIGPIRGMLYKCLYCPEWKLCQSCTDQGIHSSHLLAVIHNECQERFLDSLQAARKGCGIIALPPAPGPLTIISLDTLLTPPPTPPKPL